MITRLDVENCITSCRDQSSQVLPSKRLEARREHIKKLHAKGASMAQILNLVYGVDVNQIFEVNPYRAVDASEFHANKIAALEREVQAVIDENELAINQLKAKPVPADVGRPRKSNGQFQMKGKGDG